MKTPFFAMALACSLLSANVFAGDHPPTVIATFDRHDVAEVLRVDSDPRACGITDASMIYKTTSGELKQFNYKVWGDGCMGG